MTWRQCLDAHGALDPVAAASALRRARRAGRTCDVLLSEELEFSLADAYRVQDQVTALRLAEGERLAGWKLGYTSAVMRAQMGVEAPNFGPLTDAMLLSSPALLPAGALQPRVEPEIGLRLGRRLAGPCSVASALDACDAALACLEIVDSVWSGYQFTLEDNTADGSSAAWVAVGPSLPLEDLASLPVALSVDGELVERAVGAAAGGHPAAGLAWLAGELAARGRTLEAGDLVITGGLTSARPLSAGHRVGALFGDGRWPVEVRRPPTTRITSPGNRALPNPQGRSGECRSALKSPACAEMNPARPARDHRCHAERVNLCHAERVNLCHAERVYLCAG
ncbi:MAG: 2-keto-4-pentenoate hydratase [Streptosporangiaceae bacterium]